MSEHNDGIKGLAAEELEAVWPEIRAEGRRLLVLSERWVFVLALFSMLLYAVIAGLASIALINYHIGDTTSVTLTVNDQWVEQTPQSTGRSPIRAVDAWFYRVGFTAFDTTGTLEVGDLRPGTALHRAVHDGEPIKVILLSDGSFALAQSQAAKYYLMLLVLMFLIAFVAGITVNKQRPGSGYTEVGAAGCIVFCFIALMRAIFTIDWMAASSTWSVWIPFMILFAGLTVAANCYSVFFRRTARDA